MKSILPNNYNKFSKKHQEEWIYVYDCMKSISKIYDIRKSVMPSINNFHTIQDKNNLKLLNSWVLNSESFNFILCLIEYQIHWQGAHPSGGYTALETHKYFCGYLKVSKDYGKILIRPETTADKISELFNPVEIDFPKHKKFSRKYYLLSDNKDEIKNKISQKLICLLEAVSNIQLEFKGNKCIFRLPKSIDLKELKKLCKIGFELDKILNLKVPKDV